jgi:glutathione peroxidase
MLTFRHLSLLLVVLPLIGFIMHHDANAEQPGTALDFTVKSLQGEDVELKQYADKVVLVVNVASQCGLTPQYTQLQSLHEDYAKQGLAVLGFPCNQFGQQEPGTADDIRQFCTANYNVTFDLFEKIKVNGESADAFYKHLTSLVTKPEGPGNISWNFEKFLISRHGKVVARFAPGIQPDAPEVIKVIRQELARN